VTKYNRFRKNKKTKGKFFKTKCTSSALFSHQNPFDTFFSLAYIKNKNIPGNYLSLFLLFKKMEFKKMEIKI